LGWSGVVDEMISCWTNRGILFDSIFLVFICLFKSYFLFLFRLILSHAKI
jgi:hypothetical protein